MERNLETAIEMMEKPIKGKIFRLGLGGPAIIYDIINYGVQHRLKPFVFYCLTKSKFEFHNVGTLQNMYPIYFENLSEDEAHALALYEESQRQKESPLAQTAQTPKKPKMTPQVVGEKREHP